MLHLEILSSKFRIVLLIFRHSAEKDCSVTQTLVEHYKQVLPICSVCSYKNLKRNIHANQGWNKSKYPEQQNTIIYNTVMAVFMLVVYVCIVHIFMFHDNKKIINFFLFIYIYF